MKREEIKPGEVYGFRRTLSGPYTRVRVTGPFKPKAKRFDNEGFPIESAAPEKGRSYLPELAASRELHPLADVEAQEEEVRRREEARKLRIEPWRSAAEVLGRVLGPHVVRFGPRETSLVLTLESPEEADRLAALVREKERADRLAAVVDTLDGAIVGKKTVEALKLLQEGDCSVRVERAEETAP